MSPKILASSSMEASMNLQMPSLSSVTRDTTENTEEYHIQGEALLDVSW